MTPKSARDVYNVIGPVDGGSSPDRCAQLSDFITTHRPARCLELGFAHGVSTCYIAAALEANGHGSLTSVDNATAAIRDPSAERLLSETGLRHRVELIYEQTSYTWYRTAARAARLRGVSAPPHGARRRS
jgi:predicted O-methyltransferase YrrM